MKNLITFGLLTTIILAAVAALYWGPVQDAKVAAMRTSDM